MPIYMRQHYWILSFFLFPVLCYAQESHLARRIVDTLASEAFAGRGYVAGGDQLAAEFISQQFDTIGLLPLGGASYFQTFTTSVNTFPSDMKLVVDGQELVPGEDFLVGPGSPGISGTYDVVQLSVENMLDQKELIQSLTNARDKFLVIPTYDPNQLSKAEQTRVQDVLDFIRYSPENPAAGSIFLSDSKLTWSASTSVYSRPSIILSAESITSLISKVEIKIKNKFIKRHKASNVIGYLEGEISDSLVIFTAHYDHLGMMGPAMFAGANDNASGVAMLLSLARRYSEYKPKYSMVFIAFAGEELGLLGSRYFVENPLIDLEKIVFLLNFDISGTGDEGIQVVNGTIYKDQFDKLQQINREQSLLPQVKVRGEACNSDHCMFHQKGVPSFFIYTLGGIQAYHDVYDRAETLPLTAYDHYFELITSFVDQL